MVSCAGCNDAAGSFFIGELGHLIEGPAQFKAENALQILSLQENGIAGSGRKKGGLLERAFFSDLIDISR